MSSSVTQLRYKLVEHTHTAEKLQAYLKVFTCVDDTVNTAVFSQSQMMNDVSKLLMRCGTVIITFQRSGFPLCLHSMEQKYLLCHTHWMHVHYVYLKRDTWILLGLKAYFFCAHNLLSACKNMQVFS